jgi:amphi-Trp domain-containing protein
MQREDAKEIELVHEALQEPAQVARYLRAIAEGLESGHLRLRSGQREIELRPGSLCSFELRTTSDRQRVKVQLQLGWRVVASAGQDAALEIDGAR